MTNLPKRFRPARRLAILASIVALALSMLRGIGGGAVYDAQLAVLTATLIAVIWYTYFTYRAAHNEAPGLVVYSLEYDHRTLTLKLDLHNPTQRTLTALVETRVFLDFTEVETQFFSRSNQPPRPIILTPLRHLSGALELGTSIPLQSERNSVGQVVWQHYRVRAIVRIAWADDLGEEGALGSDFYEGPFNAPGWRYLPILDDARAAFGDLLPDETISPPATPPPG